MVAALSEINLVFYLLIFLKDNFIFKHMTLDERPFIVLKFRTLNIIIHSSHKCASFTVVTDLVRTVQRGAGGRNVITKFVQTGFILRNAVISSKITQLHCSIT